MHSIFIMQRSSHETDWTSSYLYASTDIIEQYFVHASVIIIAQYFYYARIFRPVIFYTRQCTVFLLCKDPRTRQIGQVVIYMRQLILLNNILYTLQSLLLHSIFIMQRSPHDTDSFVMQRSSETDSFVMRRSPHETDLTSYLHTSSVIITAQYFCYEKILALLFFSSTDYVLHCTNLTRARTTNNTTYIEHTNYVTRKTIHFMLMLL